MRIHPRRGDGSDAPAQLGNDGERHFVGLVGDDSEFDRGMEAVGDGIVYLAFDVLFAGGHDEGQNALHGVPGHAIDKKGGGDDDAVDHEDHPGDGGRGKFFLHHHGDDVRSARAPARFEAERYRDADSDAAGKRREDFFRKHQRGNVQPFQKHEENGLQNYVGESEEREFLFHHEKGEHEEGKVDEKYRNTLRNPAARGFFQDDGDTRDAADGKVIGGDQTIGRERQ